MTAKTASHTGQAPAPTRRPLKALLVTSDITYLPRNYADVFETLLDRAGEHIAGLVVLKEFSWSLIKRTAGLWATGCTGLAGALTGNMFALPLKRRDKLFGQKQLPVKRAATMNSPQMGQWIRDRHIDLIINLRTRCIYKTPILEAPRLGCINVHHGLLPEYRGTLCDLFALSENRPAGFTIHQMNERLDAGRILAKQTVSEPGEKNYPAYLARTGQAEGEALARLIHHIAEHDALPTGEPNSCDQPVITRTPGPRELKALRARGMIL
jgi:folate-dependent phosphoribosylglycinamide formyltransferase PurN